MYIFVKEGGKIFMLNSLVMFCSHKVVKQFGSGICQWVEDLDENFDDRGSTRSNFDFMGSCAKSLRNDLGNHQHKHR